MPIRINVHELLEILDLTPQSQNILLVGRHGIGKSEILTEHFTRRGLRVVALFLGQMSDPGDLLGLPNRDDTTGHTVFLPPYWWPADGKPIALFLDELNRARPEILQSVHDLALNRTLAGRRLPEGSVVVSAINAGEEYQVSDLDPALASRFNIYDFVPEVDEWLAWARRNKLDRRVVDFIEHAGSHLESAAAAADPLDKAPDRRAWVRVSGLIQGKDTLSQILVKAIAGLVGAQAAVAFHKFVSDRTRIKPEDVLRMDDKAKAALRAMSLQDLAGMNRQILQYIEDQTDKLTPARQKKIVGGVEHYLEHLRAGGQTEIVADFINLTERDDLHKASALLLGSTSIMSILTSYIEKVKL